MKTLITTLIATCLLSTGCTGELDETETLAVVEGGSIHDHFDGPADQLDSGVEIESSEIDEFAYAVGEPFVRDCNICVRTVSGAVCTNQACDEIDDRAASACDGQALGSVWADECNLCSCTGEGVVCTIAMCGSDASFQ